MKDWTIESLALALRNSDITVLDVAQAYVDKIMAEDAAGPNAVITLNPFWKEQAVRLQETLFSDSPLLHGIPILIKDNIDTTDMGNTAGSIALTDVAVESDAPLVTELLAAGVLILGKTNLSEWANFRSTDSTSGWSSLGGQTVNAFSFDHSPSGSSSGSAVSIAENFAVAAIGTETDGSIISPAAHNAIVGFKPTLGRVSRTGIIPIAWSQDTAGPMTKTVRDAAIMLQAMNKADSEDDKTLLPENSATNFLQHCLDSFLKGKRIGYLPADERFSDGVDAQFHLTIETLLSAGAQCIELDPVASMVTLQDHEITQMICEFPVALASYLRTRRPQSPFSSLADLVQFNNDNAEKVMPLFKQEWFDKCLQVPPIDSESYRQAQAAIQIFRQELKQQWFEQFQLDAVVTPSNGTAWKIDPAHNDVFTGGNSYIGAVTGWPSVTVPYAFLQGLPLGANFIGQPWQDATLLGIAHNFERQVNLQKPPVMTAQVPDDE